MLLLLSWFLLCPILVDESASLTCQTKRALDSATASPSMYKRDGLERDTASVQQRSLVLVKAFKTPSVGAPPREQPTRKRKRVSYKENTDTNDGNNSDSDGPRKKRKRFDEYTPLAELTANINNSFPVYEPKPRKRVFTQRFAIPTIKNKDGSTVKLPTSNVSLGIRPPIQILPRPLHDPMADHAIVLYDPTVDDRETDEERLERLKEEAREKARKEAEAKVVGMHNPHKSLKELLGGSTKKKGSKRVPVVIDPILSKILRPHQIEGVRVSLLVCGNICIVSHVSTSSCIDAPQGWSSRTSTAALWRTVWAWVRRGVSLP